MIALQLIDVKDCMHKLLLADTFDNFSIIDGSITTFATFTFDGYIHKNYYNTDEQELAKISDREFASWGDIREYCFTIIKGKNTPLSFKFVLSLSKENTRKLLERDLPAISPDTIQGLYMNFQYEDGKLECITGTSTKVFTMDKTLDHLWDDITMKYLKQKEIIYEKL
ncbi:MAG: DUF5721 family protein [Eubacteriales bacterium]